MKDTEEMVWQMVHKWCNGQYHTIPDMNRRYLMDRILDLVAHTKQKLNIYSVMQALPDETITKEAIKYDESFGLTYLSTRELQIKAFEDGASFAREFIRKAAVASEGQEEANMCADKCNHSFTKKCDGVLICSFCGCSAYFHASVCLITGLAIVHNVPRVLMQAATDTNRTIET